MIVFTADRLERRIIIKQVCKTKRRWRILRKVALGVNIAGFVALAVFIYMAYWASYTAKANVELAVGVFILIGGLCTFFAFMASVALREYAFYTQGAPFSYYANGNLEIDGDELKYIFWYYNKPTPAAYGYWYGEHYPDDKKVIYTIKKSEIDRIEIKDGICEIDGNGSVIVNEGVIDGISEKGKLTAEEFEFVLAFNEKNAEAELRKWAEGIENKPKRKERVEYEEYEEGIPPKRGIILAFVSIIIACLAPLIGTLGSWISLFLAVSTISSAYKRIKERYKKTWRIILPLVLGIIALVIGVIGAGYNVHIENDPFRNVKGMQEYRKFLKEHDDLDEELKKLEEFYEKYHS